MNLFFHDKRILVTGGTGSIGRALVEKILSKEYGVPRSVWVLSRDETKQYHMSKEINNPALGFLIGDIRDYNSVCDALVGVEIVFHVAAMKHVPACEAAPAEAVMTNVMGAENIVRGIAHHRMPVEAVIGCSTDKCCDPVSVMGMTKFIQERIFLNANRDGKTRYACCRFGNVMGSRGSVIPLFRDQIAKGGPITITDVKATRFMLPLEHAVDVLLEAGAWASPGEIYVPRMHSARVGDIADATIAAMGATLVNTKIIGLRPGERLHEIIITRSESVRTRGANGSPYRILPFVLPDASSKESWEMSSSDPSILLRADELIPMIERIL
jgi:FlaA1/EpsC-like NDP-sugar epimerase